MSDPAPRPPGKGTRRRGTRSTCNEKGPPAGRGPGQSRLVVVSVLSHPTWARSRSSSPRPPVRRRPRSPIRSPVSRVKVVTVPMRVRCIAGWWPGRGTAAAVQPPPRSLGDEGGPHPGPSPSSVKDDGDRYGSRGRMSTPASQSLSSSASPGSGSWPRTRAATYSPSTGPNLNPSALPPPTIQTLLQRGWRSTIQLLRAVSS
jgi:hypothetical protein